MSPSDAANKLREHRPVLLACEAIGWFHMAGKARIDFLRKHGGDQVPYEEEKWHDAEQPPFPWDDLLGWVKNWQRSSIGQNAWPNSFEEFTEKHRQMNPGILGLLQAAHGIVSGIEKNIPSHTSQYLSQSLPHMWLSSPFGYPKRNLFVEAPEVFTERGWRLVVSEIRRVLEELKNLASNGTQDVQLWESWREAAIGPQSYLRQAFLSTLAETRVPNNDVTLWDQSYVAAALFKSAVAGAILNDQGFPWQDAKIKQITRWRLLTISIGTDHYEARSVKIGDWTGIQKVLGEFFRQVRQLVEVDLAVGSILYQDCSTAVFSFPGERFDEEQEKTQDKGPDFQRGKVLCDQWIKSEVDRVAKDLKLETPPLVRLSTPTRSLVPLVQERRKSQRIIALPLHRKWEIFPEAPGATGHVCPVCQVRSNGERTNKGKPCSVCRGRRNHRRNDWLNAQLGYDTIWFEEVADSNDRIALLTLSLDLEPWLNGERLDSLRAQAILEWRRHNPVLPKGQPNPIDVQKPFISLRDYIESKLSNFPADDPVLQSLQQGFKSETAWESFFKKIVEDRAKAPSWDRLDDNGRAAWLVHQLFCKLPSPGRVYRFWREAQEFFEELLKEFRQIAARSDNPWRVRRLLIEPTQGNQNWEDRALYNSHVQGAPFSLLFLRDLNGFVTISNLARVLKPYEPGSEIRNFQTLDLEHEDVFGQPQKLQISDVRVKELAGSYSHLGVYQPVIPLEVSPLRCRIIVPLEAASECVDFAARLWKERFAQVWDRLPLRAGIVAFERTLPFQAVIEATRNLEHELAAQGEEHWRVENVESFRGVLVLALCRKDGHRTVRTMSLRMPDGREDVFYPYLKIEDGQLSSPRDFCHPEGHVYRHAADLRCGDGVVVYPARVALLFMDSTAARFEPIRPLYIEDWEKARELWRLLARVSPSQTALHRFWNEFTRMEREWRHGQTVAPDDLWEATLRSLLVECFDAKGAALDTLTEAAVRELLEQSITWHQTVLKEKFVDKGRTVQ